MKLQAEVRTKTGSSAARRARNEGKIPVSMYGEGKEAISLLVNRREFEKILQQEGVNAVFDIEYDGNVQKVLIKDFEKAALRDEFYSVDLQEVSKDTVLEIEVPVVLLDEEAVKVGVVQLVLDTVLVETTPDNIPTAFEVSAKGLEIGDVIEVSAIELPEGVTLMEDPEETLVTVSAPTDEPVDVDPDAAMAEPEVIGASDDTDDDEE